MATTTPNYEIDPKDPALTAVNTERDKAITDSNKDINKIIANENKLYNDKLIGIEEWQSTQEGLQKEQHKHTLDMIEQQRAQAQKDFQKEASAAYVDYKKQSNPYGVEAEQRAAMGMTNTGFSESSLVSMYNQYQVRFTAAREIYQKALLNYNNAITEAKLQNSSVLAEIAYTALEKEMEAITAWTQRSNDLLIEKANQKLKIMEVYDNKYQDVYDRLMQENTLAEEARKNSLNYDIAKQQLQIEKEKFEYQKAKDAAASTKLSLRTGGKGSSKKSKYSPKSTKSAIKAVKSGSGSVKKNSNSGSNKSSATIDMDSVLALGLGPISAKKLDSLVSSGVVREYVSGGKVKFAYTASGLKQKQLYSRLG